MRALLSLLFVFVIVTDCFDLDHATCGYDALKETPWYLENSAAIEQLAEDVATKSHLFGRDNSVLRIPVVWHVLTNSPTNYVSRNAILQEMKWLNDWFSGQNKYYNTSDMFSAVVARADDLKIRFELATKDPLGNPFDGVHYVTSSVAESCKLGEHANYYTSQGGTDIWDSRYYFNVYTCGIAGLVSGFAAYPSNVPYDYDGCVLAYKVVGNTGDSGSTLAHEAGHWLGLGHTFNGDSCQLDDWITDTPNTDKPSSNWLNVNDRCNSQDSNTGFVRCGNTVMVRNVMDYNDQKCNQYFTKGQALKMRGYLLNPDSTRFFLKTSPALAPSCPSYDCFGKSCGSDGCGGTCGVCAALHVCGGDSICRSTVPYNIDCSTAEGLTQSTTGYTVTKDNTGVENLALSCGEFDRLVCIKIEILIGW
jgi:hypothetical protein